jgi:hypothetical protein
LGALRRLSNISEAAGKKDAPATEIVCRKEEIYYVERENKACDSLNDEYAEFGTL